MPSGSTGLSGTDLRCRKQPFFINARRKEKKHGASCRHKNPQSGAFARRVRRRCAAIGIDGRVLPGQRPAASGAMVRNDCREIAEKFQNPSYVTESIT
jgi:hypothetical protein